jgi:type IV pilus assembly protein PilM
MMDIRLSLPFASGLSVGLDIGGGSLKMAKVRKGKVPTLVNLSSVPISPDLISSDGLITNPDGFTEAVIEVAGMAEAIGENVVVSAGGVERSSLLVRYVELQSLTPQEVKDLKRNLYNYIAEKRIVLPYDLRELEGFIMDCDILRRSEGAKGEDLLVMLVLARREVIESMVSAIQAAGLYPVAVEVGSTAIHRALLFGGYIGDGIVASLDIGATKTQVDVIKDGIPHFTISIPFNGSRITDALRFGLGLGEDEIEAAKRKVGVLRERQGEQILGSRDMDEAVFNAISMELSSCIEELVRYLSYYEDTYGGKVERIVLSGGVAATPGIAQFFSDRIEGVEVQVYDPIRGMRISKGFNPFAIGSPPSFSIAVGLALR